MIQTPLNRTLVVKTLGPLLALALAAAPFVMTSQGQQPATTVKVKVTEVVLPVTVRDKKGQLISTLKQEDFVLTEDGKPQPIKSFAHESSLPLRLGLLVDTSRSQENALAGERTASGKFVDEMLRQATDRAFLLHFDREVELLQDFTASKEKLHHELEEMTTTLSSGDDTARVSSGGGDEEGSRGHRGGAQMYDAIYLSSSEIMSGQPGRKAIVLFSDGVDRGSKKSLGDAVDAAEKANVSIYTVYFKGAGEHRSIGDVMDRRDDDDRRYPGGGGGYPGGGYPGGGRRGGQRPTGSGEAHTDGKKVMEQIAARTGGRFFEAKKKDSFDEIFAQITEELRGQYILTFVPEKPASKDDSTDGFHKIALKAKDENLVVVTREGYFADSK